MNTTKSKSGLALILILGVVILTGCFSDSTEFTSGDNISAIGSSVRFNPDTTEENLIESDAERISIGTQTIYIGYWQKSSINQDPIIASFDSTNKENYFIN